MRGALTRLPHIAPRVRRPGRPSGAPRLAPAPRVPPQAPRVWPLRLCLSFGLSRSFIALTFTSPTREIVRYSTFSVWLMSFNVVIANPPTPAPTAGVCPVFWLSRGPLCAYTYRVVCIRKALRLFLGLLRIFLLTFSLLLFAKRL